MKNRDVDIIHREDVPNIVDVQVQRAGPIESSHVPLEDPIVRITWTGPHDVIEYARFLIYQLQFLGL